MARELGIRITVHVGDGLWGMSKPVEQMHGAEMLGPDVTYVHTNTINDRELQIIGETGGTASIAPGTGDADGPWPAAGAQLLGAGMRPSISTDVVTTVPSDMFSAMRHSRPARG